MQKLYFTKEGAERLNNEINDLVAKLRSTQAGKGEAAEIGGNQWHDNFAFESLSEEERKINAQLVRAKEIQSQMIVLDHSLEDTERLRVGHLALLDVDGEEKEYLIGGFGDSDPDATPPVISYNTPLASPFIGEEEDFSSKVTIGGKNKRVTLLKISIPKK